MLNLARWDAVTDWFPAVEITADEEEYLIRAEFPGVDMKDVKVKIQEGILTAEGVRKKETQEKNKRFRRIARSCETLVRSCALPDDAAEDRMRAEFKDGLLLVHLPKTERTRAKPLKVSVG